MLKKFDKNTSGRDFVVGDIHGCFNKLEEALAILSFNETTDRLFSVGDLVDRGPDSELVTEWLSKTWFHAVRGNHEQMAIDACKFGYDSYTYAYNGGMWFMALTKPEQLFFSDLFESLPIAIEVETNDGLVGIVHADCPTKTWGEFTSRLEDQKIQNCAMWSRNRISSSDDSGVEGVIKLFVGHTPLKAVKSLGNVTYIDTGAVFKGPITIIEI